MTLVTDMAFAHFSGRVGRSFALSAGGLDLELILDSARELPGSARADGGFTLEFLGPSDPVLEQGIFPFEIDQDRFEIFIVPIARDSRGTRYEAVFF